MPLIQKKKVQLPSQLSSEQEKLIFQELQLLPGFQRSHLLENDERGQDKQRMLSGHRYNEFYVTENFPFSNPAYFSIACYFIFQHPWLITTGLVEKLSLVTITFFV